MQELLELVDVRSSDRLAAGDEPFLRHLDRDSQGRRRGALAGASLQKIEHTLLDRELDVLHVAVVRLEKLERRRQLHVRLGKSLAHRGNGLRRPRSRDDILTLCVDEELAVVGGLAGRWVPREADAGSGPLPLVAIHHLHDVHRCSDVVRNPVKPAVDTRPRRIPRVEDGAVRATKLFPRILRKTGAHLLLVDALEGVDQLAQIVRSEIEVTGDAARRLQVGDRAFEAMPGDAVDDLTVHLDQAPV